MGLACRSGYQLGRRICRPCSRWIRRQIAASLFYDESDSRASTRGLRLLAEFRRAFEERRPRSETPFDRLVRLRARRVERGAVHDRAKRRLRFFGEKWRDGFRHLAQGAAGLGGVRERLLYSLLRLQRHLSLEGAG